MEYNQPSLLIKDLNFDNEASNKIAKGVEKLARAVKSTLGASGKCVIYEDARGNPVITKDGVTVAESVVLYDPVENMGATLVKEAARNTVKEAGDGTTTATVLAESLLNTAMADKHSELSIRDIKSGVDSGMTKVIEYLNNTSIKVEGEMLRDVSVISCNNDDALGSIISEAYEAVGSNGVVLMEDSPTEDTYVEVVDGAQIECGLTSQHLVTNQDKMVAELDRPLVLIVASEIPNIRKIEGILEYVIKNNRSLLIVASVSQQVKSALLMNKVKNVLKVNIIDTPGFGAMKAEAIDDLALLTGATVINEELGDDLDLISIDHLGEADSAVTSAQNTVLTLESVPEGVTERIEQINEVLKKETNPFMQKKIENRLAMLSGSVGVVKVGANSKVELKEKKDRVEDAIYATKAALKEGVVAGGGVALLNASRNITPETEGEGILLEAIRAPYLTVLANAGIQYEGDMSPGLGINVVTGEAVDMLTEGIIDPVLVTKSALKNAVSVVSTIISANCVISNMRGDESN